MNEVLSGVLERLVHSIATQSDESDAAGRTLRARVEDIMKNSSVNVFLMRTHGGKGLTLKVKHGATVNVLLDGGGLYWSVGFAGEGSWATSFRLLGEGQVACLLHGVLASAALSSDRPSQL